MSTASTMSNPGCKSPPSAKTSLLDWTFSKNLVVLDGALATELEERGCNINDSLWSAKVLIEQPTKIIDVLEAYFRAYADIVTTASYQASFPGFSSRGLSSEESRKVIMESVELARNARERVLRDEPDRIMHIAGSVGPYGAYLNDGSEYRGDYCIEEKALKDFHLPRMEALIDAGADVLAFETLPSASEALVLLDMLETSETSVKAWFSFTLRDGAHLSDGTDLKDVVQKLDRSSRVIAIGFNCIGPSLLSAGLDTLKNLTTKPLIAYPNSGEAWCSQTNSWVGSQDPDVNLASLWTTWQPKGVRILGGCCRTSPKDIAELARAKPS